MLGAVMQNGNSVEERKREEAGKENDLHLRVCNMLQKYDHVKNKFFAMSSVAHIGRL